MNNNQINTNLFSLNPLPSWIYDYKTLEILDVNIAAIEHYGYSREEFISLTLKDLRPVQEIPKLISSHAGIKNKEGNIYLGIFNHKKKNGDLMRVEINGHKLDFLNRQCMLVVCQDVTELLEKEEKILQSEQRFKALVQEGSDLIAILDAEGNYKYVSPTSISVLGIGPEEFIGRNAFEFIHPDDAERTLASLQKIGAQNRVTVEPFRFQNHQSEWRWVETVLTNMLDNPAVNGIVANSRDITETVNTIKQIEENERFIRTVVECSPDCLKVIDSEGRLQFMNFNGLCQMEIDDFSNFKNKNWWTLWGAENEDLVKEALNKALKGENAQFTAFCPTAKGTPKWWDVMVSPVTKSEAAVQQLISVSRDITLQKREEQHLKLLESVITNTHDAILITEAEPKDEPGPKIIYVNEAFTRMTGYTAEELIGKTPRILQGPNSDYAELARLGRALRNWEPCEITTVNYKKNGEEFWINISVSPVADKNGWYTHWIAIERDVTEQKLKELEKELLAKISLNFSLENNLLSASTALCQTIGDYGRFDFVELWLPSIENTHIQLFTAKAASPKAKTFYEWSKDTNSFAKGEGLPGIVWDKKATFLWKDISKKDDFVRKGAAQKAGITSSMGIPLCFKGQTVGVLIVATHQEQNHLKKYVGLFEQLEEFLGSEISRKKLENDLNHLYQAIPDIVCLVDFQGRFLKMNMSGCQLLGYSEDEILYHRCEDFVHPEDRDISTNEILKLGKGKTTLKFENRYITKSGDIIWLSWIGNPSEQEGLIYATAKNITEEKKLKELNRQASKLAKIGSWEVDLLHSTAYWSEMTHRLHETDPNSFFPDLEESLDFYREDFRPMIKALIERSITTGEPFDFESVLVTAKGNERWVRVIGDVEMVDGQCRRIYGSFQDIHERKMAELAVQESEARFRGVFEIASLGIAQVDPSNGKIQLVNSYYETITGYSIGEMLDMNFLELTHPEDREKDWTLFNRAALGEVEYRNEKRYVRKDGTIVWVRIHLAFIRDPKGKPFRTVAICENITDRREAEGRLQSLADNLPGVVFQYLLYPDGTDALRNVGKASEKIWGYSPQEIYKNIDLVWNQTKAGGDFEAVKQSILASVENRSKWSIRYRTVSPDGQKRILQGLGSPEFLPDGTVLFNSVVLDITQEARNEELLELATDLSRIGSWEIDLANNKLFWSDMVHEIHQTDPKSFVPDLETAIGFYRKDFHEMVNEMVAKCRETGAGFDFEAVLITAKKQERWVRTIGNAELVDGKYQRIYGSFQDIHERKESELRLKSISDDLPGVSFQYIILPDGTDRLQGVSKAAHDIWNVSPEDCEQNNDLIWSQIKKGGDFEAVQQTIQESIKKKKKWNFRWKNVLPNGEIRRHEGYGTPNVLADGTVVFNSLIFDITEKYKALELYDEASQMARIGSWELNLASQDNTDNMYWSPMLKEILEVESQYNPSLTGGFEFYIGESKEKIRKAVETLIGTGENFDLELEVQTAKGNMRWIRCIGKAEFIEGKCERIFGSYQDIHIRKTAEIQLKTLTDNLPGVVFQYLRHADGTDQILYISEGSIDVWGLSPKECIASSEKIWQQIEAGGNLREVRESIDRSAENLSLWESEWRNVSPDGRVRWYQGIGTPQKLSNGAILWNSLILDVTVRKLFEQNYLAAQADRIDILESISDAFYGVDENWNFTYFNKEAENLLERKSEDVLGKNIWVEFSPAKGTEIERKYRSVAKTGKTETFEYWYPGDGKWYEINAYPSKGGVSAFFKNIDDRKKVAEELQKAYEEKNSILERIGDAFFALDKNWNVIYWNKRAEEIIGVKREDLVGYNLWEKLPQAKELNFFKEYKRIFKEQEKVGFEEYFPPLGRWYEANGYPSPEGISVFFRDITVKKVAEKQILAANERFEKVTDATNDAIWDYDLQRNHLFWGKGFYTLFGYSMDSIKPSFDLLVSLIHEGDRERILNKVSQYMEDPELNNWYEEYRFRKADGSYAFVIDRAIFSRNDQGNVIRVIGAMTDISEQKRIERQLVELNEALQSYANDLKRSNEELEQFAFITSHDLQEPLRMISSFMDQLKRKYEDQLDEKAQEYIHYATDGAKRMKRIILDLLEYSRASKPTDSAEKVDLNEILIEFKLLRRKVISEKNATINSSVLPSIITHRAGIVQVFHSLLDNAIKYSKEGDAPEIEINAMEKGDDWMFSIKDNGIGIDLEFFDKIFIIFQRLHNRDQYDGTGIGLSIAKRHVEFLGGKIWLESNLGEGTTFYFTIPKFKP